MNLSDFKPGDMAKTRREYPCLFCKFIGREVLGFETPETMPLSSIEEQVKQKVIGEWSSIDRQEFNRILMMVGLARELPQGRSRADVHYVLGDYSEAALETLLTLSEGKKEAHHRGLYKQGLKKVEFEDDGGED